MTMVCSEVYNMMYEPDSNIGKTIKMDGISKVYHDENTGKKLLCLYYKRRNSLLFTGYGIRPDKGLLISG